MSILEDTLRMHRARRRKLFGVPPRPRKEISLISDDEYLAQISLPPVREQSRKIFLARASRHKVAKCLFRVVSESFGVGEAELTGLSRRACYVLPRHILMYFLMRHLGYSGPEAGRKLNRDHSTVFHGVEHIKSLMATDPHVRARVEYFVEACCLPPIPTPEVTQ